MTKVSGFIQKISRYVPSIITNIHKAGKVITSCRHIGKRLRDTTLFVIFVEPDEKSLQFRLSSWITLLENLSKPNTCPKCLIIHFSQSAFMNYESTWKILWEMKFLDITILQIHKPDLFLFGKFLVTGEKSEFHQYNPYSRIYSVQKNGQITVGFLTNARICINMK